MPTQHHSKPAALPRRHTFLATTATTLLALLALLTLAACNPAASTDTAKRGKGKRGAQSGPVPVEAAKAVRHTIPITVTSLIGIVQPLRTVSVRSQVDGIIQKIHFREGDDVRAGDLLITIDRRPFENTLRIARASLDNARAQNNSAQTDLARYERLFQAALIAKEDYDQYRTKAEVAAAQLASAQAAVANAELQLGYTEIRAPITGRTGQFGLHQGALVKAADFGTALLTINQIAPISAAYPIPENVLPRVRAALHASASANANAPAAGDSAPAAGASAPGIRVTAAPRDATGPTAEGRLDFIDNTIDPATGTIVLKAMFPNTDYALWPGEFVYITMELGHEPDAILVPASAVKPGQNVTHVYVIAPDSTVQIRKVKTGRTEGALTVIHEGVNEDETVITNGHLRVTNGSKVTITTLDKFIK